MQRLLVFVAFVAAVAGQLTVDLNGFLSIGGQAGPGQLQGETCNFTSECSKTCNQSLYGPYCLGRNCRCFTRNEWFLYQYCKGRCQGYDCKNRCRVYGCQNELHGVCASFTQYEGLIDPLLRPDQLRCGCTSRQCATYEDCPLCPKDYAATCTNSTCGCENMGCSDPCSADAKLCPSGWLRLSCIDGGCRCVKKGCSTDAFCTNVCPGRTDGFCNARGECECGAKPTPITHACTRNDQCSGSGNCCIKLDSGNRCQREVGWWIFGCPYGASGTIPPCENRACNEFERFGPCHCYKK